MSAKLPYLSSPGSIKTALDRIREAATPERVTNDFVTTKLRIKGGTGSTISPFLKKIGFVASDGTPTDLYKQFRNMSAGGAAVAAAIKHGYSELAQLNEYFYELNDKELLDLIVQATGLDRENSVTKQTFSTLKALKGYADFDSKPAEHGGLPEPSPSEYTPPHPASGGQVGLNLSYTINLNLPATSDQAVFNAIFRSLKEHLLSNDE